MIGAVRTLEELADCIEREPSGQFELWLTPPEWRLITGRICGREDDIVFRDDFAKSLERRFGFDQVWQHNTFPYVRLVVGRLSCAGGDRYDPNRPAGGAGVPEAVYNFEATQKASTLAIGSFDTTGWFEERQAEGFWQRLRRKAWVAFHG
jgi:hypothetical protein